MDRISSSGIYTFGFEVSHLSIDDPEYKGESWWLKDPDDKLHIIYENWDKRKHGSKDTPQYFIVLGGRYSPNKGSYGHMGQYDREFIIDSLTQYRHVNETELIQNNKK